TDTRGRSGVSTMGNGALIGLPGIADNPAEVTLENNNIATVEEYFEQVWNQQNLAALNNLLADDFVIHRNHFHRDSRNAMRNQVIITQMNFPDLHITVESIVALY